MNEIKTEGKDQTTESFRDRLATVDAKGKRKWIFAQKPKGRFYNTRTWVSWGFFILFFALPFVKFNGRPPFLFKNFFSRRITDFGKMCQENFTLLKNSAGNFPKMHDICNSVKLSFKKP